MASSDPGEKANKSLFTTCILCGANITCASADDDEYDDEDYCEIIIIALKMWLRYLGINVSKVFEKCPDGLRRGVHEEGVPLMSDLEWGKKVAQRVCSECSFMTNKFWLVYQDFEVVRLQLEECVDKMRARLQQHYSGGGEGCSQVHGHSSLGEEEDALKMEILRKCHRRLTSVPRVRVALHHDIHCGEQEYIPGTDTTTTTDKGRIVVNYTTGVATQDESKLQSSGQRSQLGSTSVSALNHLIKTEVRRRALPCRVCGKCFTSRRRLRIHMVTHNVIAPPSLLTCKYCGQTSTDAREQESHVIGNHPYESFRQEFSKTTRKELESLIQRLLIGSEKIQVNGEEYLKCFNCPTLLPAGFEWRVHQFSDHRQTLIKLADNCGQDLQPTEQAKTHSAPSRAGLSCDVCGETFKRKRSHGYHVRVAHPYNFYFTRLPPCSTESGIKTGLKTIYNEIQRMRNERNEVRLKCPFCSLSYTTRTDCKVHIVSFHENIVVRRLNQMLSSEKAHTAAGASVLFLSGEKPPPRVCHCGKSYQMPNSFKFHQAIEHPEMYAKDLARIMTPDEITKVLEDLLDKGAIDVGSNKYQCLVCEAGFKRRDSLKYHLVKQGHYKPNATTTEFLAKVAPARPAHEFITPSEVHHASESEMSTNRQIEVNGPSLIKLEGHNNGVLAAEEIQMMDFDEGAHGMSLEEGSINFDQFASVDDFEGVDDSLGLDPLSMDSEVEMGVVAGRNDLSNNTFTCFVCNQDCINRVELSRHLMTSHLVEAFFQDVPNPPSSTTEPILRQTIESQIRRLEEGTKVLFECVHCLKRMTNNNRIWMMFHLKHLHVNETIRTLESLSHQLPATTVPCAYDDYDDLASQHSQPFPNQDLPISSLLATQDEAVVAQASSFSTPASNSCSQCRTAFSSISSLLRHLRWVHPLYYLSRNNSYCCNDIPPGTTDMDVQRVVDEIIGNNPVPISGCGNSALYECPLCQKRVLRLQALKGHVVACHGGRILKQVEYNKKEVGVFD